MTFTDPEIEKYLSGLLPPRDEVLAEMEALASEKKIPIIGPIVGRVFYQLIRLVKATRVFEMGSAIGYSTIWAARAAGEDGKVYYTDGNAENARKADAFLRRAGVRDHVEMLTGNAVELLEQTAGEFDVIFCDIDKEQYPQAFRRAVPRIRRGGLLLADNTLWYGKVARAPEDDATRGILEFNRLIYSSPELFATILPVRDGFAVCEKL